MLDSIKGLPVLIVERAGGELPGDAREFASRASNAAQEMSRRLKENFFTHLRVSGIGYHTLIRHVDDTRIVPEKVECEAIATVIGIYERLEISRQRAPGATVDFADANAEEVTKVFRRIPPPA